MLMCKKLSGWLKCSLSHCTGDESGGSMPCITIRKQFSVKQYYYYFTKILFIKTKLF